ADRRVGDEVGNRLVRSHRLAVDANDHVALLKAAARRRAIRHDRADDLAAVLGQTEAWRQILVERLEADTEIAARWALPLHQRIDNRLGKLGRDREADAD